MTSPIISQLAIRPDEVPLCLYCHGPMPADAQTLCCCTDHFYKYQIAVAASLPPLTTRIQTMREKRKRANR